MWKRLRNESYQLLMLRAFVCCTFAGRAYQHLRWDAPLRELLWKESWMTPLVTGLLGIPWQDWVSSLTVDQGISWAVKAMGLFYLCCAGLCWTVQRENRGQQRGLIGGSILLCFLGFLFFVEQFMRVGQWVEYALQISGPIFLVAALRGYLGTHQFSLGLKFAIGLTFVGHGLYAIGYYPTPGPFVTMTMDGLGLEESSARVVLQWIGYLDFALVVGMFLPRIEGYALGYAVFWGFATSAARLVSNYQPDAVLSWLDSWFFEFILRLIHGGAPLLLFTLSGRTADQMQSSALIAVEPTS